MLAVEELYIQEIRTLPAADRLQLLALIAQDLAQMPTMASRRITNCAGWARIWQGIDAQQYVDDLRSEWDAATRCTANCCGPDSRLRSLSDE